MTTIANSSLEVVGLSNDNTNINCIPNDRENYSNIYLQENDTNRKSYPQRNNRAKLNYRDIERGMYEEIRQSMWTLTGSTSMNKHNTRHDQEHEIIDLSITDDDDDEKLRDNTEEISRRVWCICRKPWDHSKVMLRCDSCDNYYHGDCIGVTKEQAKTLEINNEQFICPSCQNLKSSKELIHTKRKHSDSLSPTDNDKNRILSTNISYDQSTKRLKNSQINCIVHDCNNSTKSNWIYCSSTCIRRHINDTLQSIQRNKGMNDEDIPTSDDILLYERKTKKILKKNLVPKIEDLCTWINQHPSYEILKPNLKQSTSLTRSVSVESKSKVLLKSTTINQKLNTTKSISNRKNLIQLKKPINNKTSNINNTVDIRSKVPTALYEKILMRLGKNDEKNYLNEDIRIIVKNIEEEMYRVYGKVDNTYKNKFRSLLANISNLNNNFFYKQILSKELTAQQIVAMKSEDMLPPEEKEKRKDQFQKEVQMIINAEQQTAEEMARRVKLKVTRQGLIDNDSSHLPVFNLKEQNSSKEHIVKSKDNQISSITKIDSNESTKTSITEQSNPVFSEVDLDNDYIEPESPTGVDALIYDEDDDNDLNNFSHPVTNSSSIENTELISPYQQIIRDDYNPSKAKNEITSISPSTSITSLSNQWRGTIHPSDTKISCQSVHIYGESDYLIKNIPEELIILGRLRLGDLWDYIRDSLTVRDVLILTLQSSLNTNDNEIFSQYVDTMRILGRAAVISKCTNSSLIRDMYILAADTKECPINVLSSLFLPTTFESKQLFLVIIGTGKRTIKTINHSNENQLLNNLVYKPVVLQNLSITRDPRLLRNKDPRLNRNENIVSLTQTSIQYSNDDLLKLISDSFERIRHSSTAEGIHLIVISTIEILKANSRDDLCVNFNDNLRIVMSEWQTKHGNSSNSTSTTVTGDNLMEENMDVDDDHQDDKDKKQIITSSNSNSIDEFNDIDYRFLDQDMDDHQTTNNHRKQRRKSRFSDLLPSDKKFKSTLTNKDFQLNNTKISSPKLEDKSINSLLNNKFQPIINSKPIPLSFSKDTFRRHKSNNSSTINNNDIYEKSPKLFEDLMKHVQSYGYQGLAFTNDNWLKQTLPINPVRSTAMLNLIVQQQKIKNRFSSNTNQWRSNSNNNYMTQYHDFDQPEE